MDTALLIGMIMIFCSLTFIAFGFWQLHRERNIREGGIRTEGLVVDLISQGSRVSAVLEYETEQGVVRSKTFSASGILFNIKKGDRLPISYDRSNPKQFILIGNKITSFMWLMFISLGFISAALGLFILCYPQALFSSAN